MANHSDIKKILSRLLEKSEKNIDKHQAIALVGDWGIGKTYLWNKFYEKEKKSLNYDKYAYISLFGISSLEELKLKIATEIVSIKLGKGRKKHIMPSFKKLGRILSSASFSESGVSVGVSSSVVSSLVLSSLKNTIVCLDDLERRSKNLPIDEVMGLVNYLTQERNCSVVCLLNRDEINDEQYDNYKEKVFTHELSIDDSLDTILEKFPENDHEIIKNFYEIFDIKNIRFYEKVLDLYSSFIDDLNNEKLSNTSKNKILSSFLLFSAFDSMPTVMGFGLNKLKDDYSEKNSTNQHMSILDGKQEEQLTIQEKKEWETKKQISRFAGYFVIYKWQLAILEFMNSYNIDETVKDAIDKDLFEEEILVNKRLLDEIHEEYYNLELQPDFASRLSEAVKKNIKTEYFHNISFWCNKLEGMGEQDKSNEIITLVKKRIDQEMKEYSGNDYLDYSYPGLEVDKNDKFHNYIKSNVKNTPHPTTEQIIQFFINHHQNKKLNIGNNFLQNMTKKELEGVIWADISKLEYCNRKNFIKSVITCDSLDSKQKEQFRQWAVDILQEKADTTNSEKKYVIAAYLKYTNDLRKD